jgi:aspartyl-tRNA(Asn)/glutamyl-tRNA(Gln) amidotransferase subunit A
MATDPDRQARLQALDGRWRFLEDATTSLPVDAVAPVAAGPLDDLTIGVKANFAVAGHPLTAGIAGRVGAVQAADSPLVAALRTAGARIVARLTMDEGAFGATTRNPAFGDTENPAAPGRVAGGSSGGSAAAVAAGAVDAALGSDTLGSVRIPAAYCGVWGLKPGHGVLTGDGMLPLAPRFDAPGVLARDAATLARVVGALGVGGVAAEAPRVAVPAAWPREACAPAVLAGFERATRAAEALGLLDAPLDWPALDMDARRRDALVVTAVEAAARLSGEPGISEALRGALVFGHGAGREKLAGAEARLADFVASAPPSLTEGRCLLLTPTTPEPAFPLDAPAPPTQALFTAWVNALGWPALALPVPGPGAPVSAQLVGVPGSEQTLLAVGAALAARMVTG